MDFMEGLSASQDCTCIFVVVDQFSKYAHFIPLRHPITALQLAEIFLEKIVKLYGMPNTVVSDRDHSFTSNFWQKLFKLLVNYGEADGSKGKPSRASGARQVEELRRVRG